MGLALMILSILSFPVVYRIYYPIVYRILSGMKNLVLIIFCAWTISSCSSKDEAVSTQPGCISGLSNGSNKKVLLDCGTKAQTSDSKYTVFYHSISWEVCGNCK